MDPDRISPYILIHCTAEISNHLYTITQHRETYHPIGEKQICIRVRICPIFKKGNRSSPSNYRPISLTSSCCKVLEHIIFHSIMDHIQPNNILIDNQHGFGPVRHSLIEDVSYAISTSDRFNLV